MKMKKYIVGILLTLYGVATSITMIRHELLIKEPELVRSKVEESIVSLEDVSGKGRGTGFVTVAKSGARVIVTNAHVCDINPTLPIFAVFHRFNSYLRHRTRFPAIVLAKDETHDLCIMSVPSDLKVTPLDVSDRVYMDEDVYIIGYPSYTLLSVAHGYVRGHRLMEVPYNIPIEFCVDKKFVKKTVPIIEDEKEVGEEQVCLIRAIFMFTDALSDMGASGSPALNSSGEVIGVMSVSSGNLRSFSYLVPLKNLQDFLSKF